MEDKDMGIVADVKLKSENIEAGIVADVKLNSENTDTGNAANVKLNSKNTDTGIGANVKLNSENTDTGIGANVKLNSENTDTGIVVNVKLNREDTGEMNLLYLKALKYRHRKSWFFKAIFFVLILFFFATLLVTSILTRSSWEALIGEEWYKGFTPFMYVMLFYVVLYIIYNLGMPILIKVTGKKQYDSNKLAQKETQYLISFEGIKVQDESSVLNWRYEEVYKVMETTKYLFLYESTSAARIIPKRCFAREEDLFAVISLLKEKLPVKKYEYYKM